MLYKKWRKKFEVGEMIFMSPLLCAVCRPTTNTGLWLITNYNYMPANVVHQGDSIHRHGTQSETGYDFDTGVAVGHTTSLP
jgi:hypothetical protein